MVGSVNKVAPLQGSQRPGAHKPARPEIATRSDASAQEAGTGLEPDKAAPLAASERLGYAKLSQISSVLTILASARTSGRGRAAFALPEAHRKLRRLKAEALAAAASGDRKAAAFIARELTEVAREIADAARDYAAAGGEAGLTAASLAEAAATIEVGASPEQDATASETQQADAHETDMAAPTPSVDDVDRLRSLPEDEAYPGALLRQDPDGRGDDTVRADAHEMLGEALALKRAMKRIMTRPPAGPATIDPMMQTGIAASGAQPIHHRLSDV